MVLRVKLFSLIIIFSLSLLYGCGYKPDNTEIQERIYTALNVNILNGYKLIDSGENSALGDFKQYFMIEFSESFFSNFIEKIDLSEWVNIGSAGKIYQFTHQINDREKYRLSLSKTDKTLKHEYIRE